MKNKRLIIFGMILLFGILILKLSFISAVGSGVCCEKLKNNGLWCQNVLDESECDSNYLSLPTSCQASSFCTMGTCVDKVHGICIEGAYPQTCQEDGGYWTSESIDQIPECSLGCCILGNSALFVTATECTFLSGSSGITDIVFDTSYSNELSCVASVLSDEEGACVYQTNTGMTSCQRLSKKLCDEISASDIVSDSVSFYEGYLCSAPELGTICGPTKDTICDADSYDVYFKDTCGNKANIYDASRIFEKSPEYWTKIENKASCDDGYGNKNSATCGDCEYFAGSTCKNYKEVGSSKPQYGNNICSSLDCGSYDTNGDGRIGVDEKNYRHGESWCAKYDSLSEIGIYSQTALDSDSDLGTENLPGSRYVVLECREGEVLATACDGFRQTLCAEDYYDFNENGINDVSDYSVANCVPNKWQDCVLQNTTESCENGIYRDCIWVGEGSSSGSSFNVAIGGDGQMAGICVPKFAPGFNFWEEQNFGAISCEMGSVSCTILYEGGILGGDPDGRIDKCTDNCYCIPGYTDGAAKNKYEKDKPDWHPESYEEWINSLDLVCSALGDCGSKYNFIGENGYERNDVIDTGELRG